MERNDYRRINNYKNYRNQIRVNKIPSNFKKSTPILNPEKNCIYNNNKVNKNVLKEMKRPIKSSRENNKNQIINQSMKPIHKSDSSNYMNQFQKYPENKIKNSSTRISCEANYCKNYKMSRSFNNNNNNINNSPTNYSNANKFIYNKTKISFDSVKKNDVKNLKKFNGIYGSIPMKILLNKEGDIKKQDKNFFYTKIPTRKISPKSQQLSKTNINNGNNFVKLKIDKKDLNKNYRYNNNFTSTNQKIDPKELIHFNPNDHLKTDDNIINSYNLKNNRYINIDKRRVYLENTNLTKSNKTFNDKEFVLKFAKNSYKKDLFSNLTLFCDKVEDYCLGIFEKFFIIFIKNLKNYQKKSSNTNRTLLLKRLFEKKKHIRRSTSDEGLDQKHIYKQNSYSKIEINNNKNSDKIVDFQRSIINKVSNINQDDYIKMFNDLLNHSLNFEKKRPRSPVESNTIFNRSTGSMFGKMENNNIFTKNISSFNEDYSNSAKFENYDTNKYIKENNINSIKKIVYSNMINENNRIYNRSLDKISKNNNQNINSCYINTEFFNNKNAYEDKNMENNNAFSKMYDLNTTNSRVYSKPVLRKNSSKNFDLNKNENTNTLLKGNKIYDTNTYFNLIRKKSDGQLDKNQKELKEKIIKNVCTPDKRLHVFIKYIFYAFNRTNNNKIKSRQMSLLKLLKIKNKNIDTDFSSNTNEDSQSITSFNQKLYKVENVTSIEIIRNSNNKKNINKYLLNAVIFFVNLLQKIFDDKDKHLLNDLILNLKKNNNNSSKTNEKPNQIINVNRSKNMTFRKIIHVRSNNDNFDSTEKNRFKKVPQLSYSDYKNRNTNNNKSYQKNNSELKDNDYLSVKKRLSDNDEYNNRTSELKINKCVSGVQSPKIVTKIKIVNIINKEVNNDEKNNENKINDGHENKEKENEKDKEKDNKIESRLEKLKKLKLGKLFNNLDHDNKIINIIKNQFVDWNTKNAGIQRNKSNEKKYSVKTFQNVKNESKDKEVYESMNEEKNNNDDKGEKTGSLKKNLTNFSLGLENNEKGESMNEINYANIKIDDGPGEQEK